MQAAKPKRADVPYPDIGERLRRIRLMMGYDNQTAFAVTLLKVDAPRYSNWEGGRARMKFEEAILVCQKTGVTLDYLIRGETGGLSAVIRRDLESQA